MKADREMPEPAFAAVTRRRMVRVTAARLLLAIGALAVALAFIGVGREGGLAAETALYVVLAAGFLETALFAAALPFVRRLGRLGAFQLVTDSALVTALVHFSGGSDSIFSFLYLPITLYGALLFERRGAYGSAALSSAGYGLALWAAEWSGTRALFGGPLPGVPLSALWVVHAVALLLVAVLGTALSRELRLAAERLAESDSSLRELRDLHERIVESLTSGLLTMDGAGDVTSFNPGAERITGRTAADAIGCSVEDVLPGAREIVTAPRGPDERVRARMPFTGHEGVQGRLGISGSILRGPDAEPTGHVVIFQDVTDVLRMEEELRRSERLAAAGQLAADMAHEIRNPLAAISGSIEMLREERAGAREKAQRERLMEIVLREVQRLDSLIADFLQFARPPQAAPEPSRLGAVVEDLVKMFEGARPEGVEVQVDVAPDATVMADPTQLRQLLWNLVLNAAQAMPDGGELRIEATAQPARGTELPQGVPLAGRNDSQEGLGRVEITVSDTGVGIAPEVLERVFDPFFTTKKTGSGLGLATVHRIVEGHGGNLRIDSRAGRGTAVRVCLPAAEESS